MVSAPIDLVESIAGPRFPAKTDNRLRGLMDRNTNGALSGDEKEELEALVELSESMAILRARALNLLGRKPSSDLRLLISV